MLGRKVGAERQSPLLQVVQGYAAFVTDNTGWNELRGQTKTNIIFC
jgi:hypothetical protein